MTKELVMEEVYQILHQMGKLRNLDKVNENTMLFEECGLDSASVIELVVAIEDKFGFEFDAEAMDLRRFANVSRITDNILQRLA